MSHYLLPADWDFIEESYSEVEGRYSGFGANLFLVLEKNIPAFLSGCTFFRSPNSAQPDDVWAIYNGMLGEFAIQLEPSGEVICLWNKAGKHYEVGTWADDESAEVLSLLKKVFIK